MYKINAMSVLAIALTCSSIAAADSVTSNKSYSSIQCTTSSDVVNGAQTPTVKIDTRDRLVRGLCQGGNSANGVTLGSVIGNKGGHLSGLPIWWKDGSDTRILKDICFQTKAEKDWKSGNKYGTVTVVSEDGKTAVTCHEGCSGQKFDFGTGDFC